MRLLWQTLDESALALAEGRERREVLAGRLRDVSEALAERLNVVVALVAALAAERDKALAAAEEMREDAYEALYEEVMEDAETDIVQGWEEMKYYERREALVNDFALAPSVASDLAAVLDNVDWLLAEPDRKQFKRALRVLIYEIEAREESGQEWGSEDDE